MTTPTLSLENLAPEILLHIFAYLDLPDLVVLSRISRTFAPIAADPALHRNRLLVVAPSRVNHHLGSVYRPTVGDLVQRGVMRGLGIERRWKSGMYFYSPQSVKQYNTSQRLQRTHVQTVISAYLHKRHPRALLSAPPSSLSTSSRPSPTTLLNPLAPGSHLITARTLHLHLTPTTLSLSASASDPYSLALHETGILPDIESSRPRMARSLLPALHRLKWALTRDQLARDFRARALNLAGPNTSTGLGAGLGAAGGASSSVGAWLTGPSGRLLRDGERVRLALCPSVKRLVSLYEQNMSV